jgi:aminomethyltransferase
MGLEVAGDNVAAEQQPLKADGKTIGSVVVGFFAPYVGKNLAYAYLDSEYAKAGNQVSLEIEGADTNARVVEMPFYDPEGKRMRT